MPVVQIHLNKEKLLKDETSMAKYPNFATSNSKLAFSAFSFEKWEQLVNNSLQDSYAFIIGTKNKKLFGKSWPKDDYCFWNFEVLY